MIKHTWEERGLYRLCEGKLDPDEFVQADLDIHGDVRVEKIDYVINDFTKVTEAEFDQIYARLLGYTDQLIEPVARNLKIANVTADQKIIDATHIYMEMMKGTSFRIKIFDTLESARSWV